MSRARPAGLRFVEAVARILLALHPPSARRPWQGRYVEAARHRWHLERGRGARCAALRALRVLAADALRSLPAEWKQWRGERRFSGGVELTAKKRSMRGWLEGWIWDSRIAARALLRRPAASLLVVGTLALGIGANAAIFGALDRIVLHPLPFEGAERAVYLMSRQADQPFISSVTPAEYERWRQGARSFEHIEAFRPGGGLLVAGDDVEQVDGAGVSVGLAGMLGATPVAGRMFTPDDAAPNAPPVMMVAEEYWRSRMGADPAVIGSTLTVSDVQRTVIGVWPRTARFRIEDEPVFFTPLQRGAEIDRRFFSVAMGLLAQGVTPQDAEADLAALAAGIEDDPDRRPGSTEVPVVLPVTAFVGHDFVEALWILFVGAGLLVVVAGFNAASLLLNRAVDREQELGVRLALGGGSRRLVRHFGLEGGVLAGLGAVIGAAAAESGARGLGRLAPTNLPEAALAGTGARTILYAFGLVLVLTAICGLVPAIHLRSPAVRSLVTRGQRSTGRARHGLRSSLVAAQVALAVVLLIGSALTLRSLRRIEAIDLGFDIDGLSIVTVRTPLGRYEGAESRATLADRVSEALAVLPGVRGVSISGVVPLSYTTTRRVPYLDGETPPPDSGGEYSQVASSSPGFFAVTGIPLLEGRDFTEAERRAARTSDLVIVNHGFAARYRGSVVGRRLHFPGDDTGRRIIGVVGDVRTGNIRDRTIRAQVYYPDDGVSSGRSQRFLVRTSGDPEPFLGEIRNRLRMVDPDLLLSSVETGPAMVAERSAGSRFLATILAVFGAVSLTLSIAGVYGAVALSVSRRTREIGIRMALGAWPLRLVWTVVSDMLRPVLLGLAVGLGLAGLGARYLADVLYEVSPRDPASFVAATLILGAAAVLAAHLPARRATRVDPTEALRRE